MKLTRWQFICVMISLEVCMTIWLTISPALRAAKQDAWISILLGGGQGLAIALLMGRVSRLYPDQTIIQYSNLILGKWAGKAVSMLYFLAWYSVAAVILRDAADFLQLALFRQTPIYAIVTILLLLMVYINYKGDLQVIGRFGEIAGPLLLIVVGGTFVLNLGNIQPELIRPILSDYGVREIIQGSFTFASFLGEAYFLLMLMPFLTDRKGARRDILWVIAITIVVVTLATVLVIMLFGPYHPAKLLYPYFYAVRYISLLEFIEHMDIWVIIVWLFAVFVKLSLYMFICSYGTAQWLGIKSWKSVIWWFAAFLFFASVLPPNVTVVISDYAQFVWIRFVFPILMVALPLLLLIVGTLRKRSSLP
ncbi:hypothetical protein FE782_18980 [Paenibacillus antri]|uniref:Uncharacterized protein n=1 Tax=Paenibacillus antri TaxID=2582848 RepID=A0A5R9G344_9BACL|nr:endospore germination permease [Paenibacillus antri]TLS50782.1 hypothetical protein FE782_18980 [Paenibacillus antri]